MDQKTHKYQIAVIGGGPAGLTLSAILGSYGLEVVCIDKDPVALHLSEDYDGRTTAISYGSRNVLSHAGIWEALSQKACPIRDIRILDGASPVLMSFLSEEMDGKSFGWIVENRDLRALLYQKLQSTPNVLHITGQAVRDININDTAAEIHMDNGDICRAGLIVGADGRASITRRLMQIPARMWMYDQMAHVCVVHHSSPHDNIAYEHFREEGPFAVLPMCEGPGGEQRSAVVWSDHRAGRRQNPMSDESFLAAIKTRFPEHYGDISLGGYRATYPLGLLHARHYTAPRVALVAEAAHAMHPIAGQGLNMSLRDVAQLAELLIQAQEEKKDFGDPGLLKAYEQARRFDNTRMLAATDGLTRLYSSKFPLIRHARKTGVRAIAAVPPAKKFFMSQAMGLNGRLSRFVRDAA